jgi:predicted lipid-binding transport protein (Tim44 family)
MGNGLQFIDIIIFAMIAAYLVFRLRNVLGKRDDSDNENGFQDLFSQDPSNDDNVVHLQDPNRDDRDDAIMDNDAGDDDAAPADPTDPLSIGLRQIKDADSGFNAGQFADGANMAFEMILNAYTDGDAAVLKNLLNGDVFGNFNKAIIDREQAGETLEDTLVDIKSNTVVEAYMQGTQAFVTVKFVTEQVNATRDENGDVVDGDPNKIITVTDFWTFARDTKSRDPNWKLVATRSLD